MFQTVSRVSRVQRDIDVFRPPKSGDPSAPACDVTSIWCELVATEVGSKSNGKREFDSVDLFGLNHRESGCGKHIPFFE